MSSRGESLYLRLNQDLIGQQSIEVCILNEYVRAENANDDIGQQISQICIAPELKRILLRPSENTKVGSDLLPLLSDLLLSDSRPF